MGGYHLLKPVKIKDKANLPEYHRKHILSFVKDNPCKWMYGHVDAVFLPPTLHNVWEKPLISINNKDKNIKWSNAASKVPEMPYGRGSIGTHIDELTGVTLLVLLFCEPWSKTAIKPEYNGTTGEFISGDSVIELEVGDSVIFDDRVPHAWLTNSAWAFAAFPLSLQKTG